MKTITGNTYPVKEAIKALGGKWNKEAQGWDVPDEMAAQAQALVDGAPKSKGPYKAKRSCGCKGKYHSSWCPKIYGEGGYYDRKESETGA